MKYFQFKSGVTINLDHVILVAPVSGSLGSRVWHFRIQGVDGQSTQEEGGPGFEDHAQLLNALQQNGGIWK